MEKFIVCLNKLQTTENCDSIKEVYCLCAHTDVENVTEQQLSECVVELNELIVRNVLRKDLIYLSLLINKNERFLRCFIDNEIHNELNLFNDASLFNYVYYQRRNWIENVTELNFNLDDFHDDEIKRQIEICKILRHTNTGGIDVGAIERLLEGINNGNLDEFIRAYLNQVGYNLKIIKFVKSNGPDCNLDDTALFKAITQNRLLNVFSDYLKLDKNEIWTKIIEILQNDEARSNVFEYNRENANYTTDIDSFKSFIIITNIIKCVLDAGSTNTKDLSELLHESTQYLLNLTIKAQIEVLENIFALCFIRTDHLQQHDDEISEKRFLCTDKQLRLILTFVKSCIEEVRTKYKGSEENQRLNELKKHVSDGLWRLEMITDLEKSDMVYMLSKPEYLIKMCLKQNRFDKVHQVVQIFNLDEEELTHEIIFTENLNDLRQSLTKLFKLKKFQHQNPIPKHESISAVINNFKYCLDYYDIFDIALTLTGNYEDCKELLDELQKHHNESDDKQPNFNYKILQLFENIALKDNLSLREIINNPRYNFDADLYEVSNELHNNLAMNVELFKTQIASNSDGSLSNKHSAHKTFLSINDLLTTNKDNVKYLMRVFNYLKGMLKIFGVEGNHCDILSPHGKLVSYFEILKFQRSGLMKKLIYERDLDPRDFEHIFTKLKIDLLYSTTFNCFPCGDFIDYQENALQKPSRNVFTYIQKRNWLLAFIIGELFDMKDFNADVSQTRTKYLTNYLNLDATNNLKILFANNSIKTILHCNYLYYCIDYLNKNVFVELSNDQLETAQEIFEDDFKCNWRSLLELCESVPEYQAVNCKEFTDVKDRILCNLLMDKFEEEHFKYVQYIKNDDLRREMILKHFDTWPGDFCIDLLKAEVCRTKKDHVDELRKWLRIIEFCEKVKATIFCDTWSDAHNICMNNKDVLHSIFTLPKIDLLIDYCDLYEANEEVDEHLSLNYIATLFHSGENFESIELLFNKLSINTSINLCLRLLKHLKDLKQLQSVTDYLLKHLELIEDKMYLKNVQISIKMLQLFGSNELEQFWCLISDPLDILETLLMNTKLDKLGCIINAIKSDINVCEIDDKQISIENIDDLLRKYAEKSLEFRVVLEPHPKFLKASNYKLMESLDSLYGPDRKCFVMPETVPAKTDWIPNNEVLECMCCQNITFSMFNRRHHCRRCGRVVCFNCSTKRMLVPTYGDILVRVCTDCFDQSHDGSAISDTMSSKSIMYDFWLLSDNDNHNTIVRQEFSYEHAPSVSLCLSIMKSHSKTPSYPKFLLDQCNKMMSLLQPVDSNAPQEVDYVLVIKMLKSLAIAAKMLSSECHLQWGTSQADRILSQADLFGLLAERGCLNLLPQGVPYVDATILRKLRDKLLEMEQWNFALDVSTKAGLDNGGVFAAWGKSCLKAGRFHLAREKFQRCFDKGNYYDFYQSADLDENHERKRSSTTSDHKPSKNPTLLNQIIQILESQTIKFDAVTQKDIHASHCLPPNTKLVVNDPAVCIKSKLRNLKAIAQGNYVERNSTSPANKLEPVFFKECIYYLKKYGSHLSLLQFYIKHNCLNKSLFYIVENNVNIEIFIEVYMLCLKQGKIDDFLSGMSKIDPTLELWKDYLRNLCIHFEKQSYLNSLYQLQQFMGDFVRAAMTCIKFYKDNVTSFSELSSNIHFLQKAEDHLRQELDQHQWVEVNAGKFDECKNNFEEKSLTNSLVMKIDSKDIDKHINTIKRQSEITSFLAEYELDNKHFYNILPHITPTFNEDLKNSNSSIQLPTLFGTQVEKLQLAVLAITAGDNVENGYGLAVRIIQDYKLKPIKVYCQSGRQLARENRYNGIAQLVNCIRTNGSNDAAVTDMCDEMLALAVRTLSRNGTPSSQLENLIKLITDKATKISIYIETKQLKSAYLLAAKHSRYGDIRRILREAEMLNKPDIKKLCQKLLQTHSHSHKEI